MTPYLRISLHLSDLDAIPQDLRHRPLIDKGQEYADNSKQSLYAGIRNAY